MIGEELCCYWLTEAWRSTLLARRLLILRLTSRNPHGTGYIIAISISSDPELAKNARQALIKCDPRDAYDWLEMPQPPILMNAPQLPICNVD